MKHKERPIKDLKFVVPKNMKNYWLGCCSVASELAVVLQHSEDLSYEAGTRVLIASEVKKVQTGPIAEVEEIELIAANQVQGCPFGQELRCQAKDVRLIAAAGKKGYRYLACFFG